MTILDVTFDDPIHGEQHVVVESPYGSGGNYHVLINNYFKGQIVHTSDGWRAHVKLDVLTQDDIDSIIEMIEIKAPKTEGF